MTPPLRSRACEACGDRVEPYFRPDECYNLRSMNQLDLNGRVAVVTGGASGIGLAIARRLAASGARLALWDARADSLAAAAADLQGTLTTVIDVRDYASVERARDAAIATFGRIDILVNSAGITGPNVVTWEYPIDGWRDVLDVNLTGTFHCARAVVEPMRVADYGRIVNIASVAGKE
ncbi:MAG: 2-dehydro-3-deoxy-L-rhamnonate dehydrogenase, partial [Candidatus Eremiobacteraeota bacterium]|nr:2-dehydro-3-deoxy-L-rhamnonate dehydrogenase [Candidatus Eremiobacteraeota bacterium]